MQFKKMTKIISVVLALALMVSALPLNFLQFMNNGKTYAEENDFYKGAILDATTGEATNKEDATYVFNASPDNTDEGIDTNVYIWLSETSFDAVGRKYKLEFYSETNAEFTLFLKDFTDVFGEDVQPIDSVSIFGEPETALKQDVSLDSKTLITKNILIKDSSKVITGAKFFALQNNDNESVFTFPLTDLDCAPLSEIEIFNAQNNVITYTNDDNLKIDLSTSMNGPFEMFLYDAKTDIDTNNGTKTFEEIISAIDEKIASGDLQNVKKSSKYSFATQTFTVGSEFLSSDSTKDYTIILKDKFGHVATKEISVVRSNKLVKVHLVTSPNGDFVNSNASPILTDKYGVPVKSVITSYVETNSDFSFDIPNIKGYTFSKTSLGNVIDSKLTYRVSADTDIYVYYEAFSPKFDIEIMSSNKNVYPKNPLSQYPSGSSNIFSFKINTLVNNGNVDFKNGTVVIEMPQKDANGTSYNLENMIFSTGTFLNVSDDAKMEIHYSENGSTFTPSSLGTISLKELTEAKEISLPDNTYFVKIIFNENALKSGVAIGTKPTLDFTLNYNGDIEEQDFTVIAKSVVDYIDDENTEQKIEKETTGTSKILNPVHKLTIKYVNKLTNEEIKATINEDVKYHNEITADTSAVTIAGYKFSNTEYSANTVSKNDKEYMPNSDVTVTHYYFEKRPYIADTAITARYDNVYLGDNDVLYFNDIGAYLKSESEGNVPMYKYEMLLTVPKELQLRRLALPAFAGNKVSAKIEYRLSPSASWTVYTADSVGESATIDSKNAKTLEISNMYDNQEASDLYIRITYGNLSVNLPSDFKAQGSISLTGTIVSDKEANAKVSLKTSVTYPNEVSGEEEVFSKNTDKTIAIYQPSISDVEEDANLTVPNSEKYTYVFNNIKNNGSAPLKDFKFVYDFDKNTYLDSLDIGTFVNVPSAGNVTIETHFANSTKTTNVISYSDLINPDDAGASQLKFEQNLSVDKIIVTFGDIPVGFANNGGIKVTTFTRLDDGKDTEKFTANAELTANWVSENNPEENKGVLSDKFTTETTVSRFDKIDANISISNNIVLPSQTTDVSINHFENKNKIDLFNVNNTVFADDVSAISKVTTGAYSYNAKYDYEKLIIYAYTSDGISKIYENAIPTTSVALEVPENTIKVAFVFPVMQANFTTTEAPVITFVTKATADSHIKNELKYNVGVYATDIKITDMNSVETIGTTKTSSITDEEGLLTVGSPSVVKPTFTIPETTYFSDIVSYKANGIKNDGNISLYQTVIAFVPSEFETAKFVNIGKWTKEISGTIGYAISEEIDGQISTELVNVKNFENVKELEDVEIPTTDKTVIMVYILINELQPNVEMTSDAIFGIKLDENKVQPKTILNGKIAFNTNYGIVKDGNAITQDEIANLTNIALTEQEANVLVVKPAIIHPTVSVSSETVEYRGQFSYTISNIKNTGNTDFDKLEIVEIFSQYVRFISLKTPVFNELTSYNIYYVTNMGDEWILLQEGVNSRESVEIFAPELSAGEYVTYLKLEFKDGVKEEFASTSDMVINCINWSSAYSIEEIESITEVNIQHGSTQASARMNAWYTPEIPSILQAGFEISHPEKIFPGQRLELVYKNIKNVSEATINKHTLTQYLTSDYKVIGVNTGSYETGFSSNTLQILYKTNLSKENEMFLLKSDVSISENQFLEFPALEDGEYITAISFKYGDTKEGFTEITSPSIVIEPLETLENSNTYELESEFVGFIDGETFGEKTNLEFKTDFGFVNVTAKDANGKVIATYKVYGNVGENFTINEVTLKGYKTISADGDVSGTYKLGESGNITFVCKEVPKTAYTVVTDWKFIVGSIILITVGLTCFIPKKKKEY